MTNADTVSIYRECTVHANTLDCSALGQEAKARLRQTLDLPRGIEVVELASRFWDDLFVIPFFVAFLLGMYVYHVNRQAFAHPFAGQKPRWAAADKGGGGGSAGAGGGAGRKGKKGDGGGAGGGGGAGAHPRACGTGDDDNMWHEDAGSPFKKKKDT